MSNVLEAVLSILRTYVPRGASAQSAVRGWVGGAARTFGNSGKLE